MNSLVYSNDIKIKKALVKIYTSHQGYNYNSPWQDGMSYNSTATGFIIEGNKIITNAHAVLNSKYLQIRKEGDSKKYKANVKFISEDYDLALVEVEDNRFYENTESLKLGELSQLEDKVTVYGYPLGGDKLSTTQGIVSRIEHNSYTLTTKEYLIGQTDAAINRGNSGGPVINDNKVVGVAFSGLTEADNIAYFIPVNILKHFLDDIKDNNYDGAPEIGVLWSIFESVAHRKMLGLEDDSKGVLILKTFKNSPFENILKKNDVLLKLDNYEIEYDGSVEFRKNEKTDLAYVYQQKKYGDDLSYEILRDKKIIKGSVKLNNKDVVTSVIKSTKLEDAPSYLVYGGLIFEPLTDRYLIADENDNLISVYSREKLYENYEELVILVRVLPFDINLGYGNLEDLVITKVNGENYKNFKEFVNKVVNSEGDYITFETEVGFEIVLDRKEVELQKEILMLNYNVTSEMSEDIKEFIKEKNK